MGIFDPIWKTEDERKLKKALDSVHHIRNRNKLNEIVLSAPLGRVKVAALARLHRITNGDYRPDEATRMKMLLSVDIKWPYQRDNELYWYVDQLENGLSDERLMELVQKASGPLVRERALRWISDPACFIQLGNMPDLSEELMEDVAERVRFRSKRTMAEVSEDEALPQALRSAAQRLVAKGKERAKREEDYRKEKRQICEKNGHKWKLIKSKEFTYKESESGMTWGRDVLYRCENCGKESWDFIEGHTDSV